MEPTLQSLILEIFKQRAVIETIEERLEKEKEIRSDLEAKALKKLEQEGTDQCKVNGLGTIFIKTLTSVKIPREPGAKKEFYDYLKARGVFEEIVSINSATLNALYKDGLEEAIKAGNDKWKLPGIEAPTITKKLGTRKS